MSMDSKLWEALPATTNAQESLHFQLYHAVGCDKRFFERLKSLYSWVLSFKDSYKNKQSMALFYVHRNNNTNSTL